MSSTITSHFRQLSDLQFEELFKLGAAGMTERLQLLEKQLLRCENERERFQALFAKLDTNFAAR
jgi:hypothetical protein